MCFLGPRRWEVSSHRPLAICVRSRTQGRRYQHRVICQPDHGLFAISRRGFSGGSWKRWRNLCNHSFWSIRKVPCSRDCGLHRPCPSLPSCRYPTYPEGDTGPWTFSASNSTVRVRWHNSQTESTSKCASLTRTSDHSAAESSIADAEHHLISGEKQLVENKKKLEKLCTEAANLPRLEERRNRLSQSLDDPIFAERTRWDRERTWIQGHQDWVQDILDTLPDSLPTRSEFSIDINQSTRGAYLRRLRRLRTVYLNAVEMTSVVSAK